ncbi:nitroreductase family protein [Microbacter margulisiae]|uniref:Nitroreductase n=1 Tax=Microbacter margulisiae TaxID=1350067 RepID=A0A7W5H243_9PORP|nr:nitroreductase family protein [Microbacter margulisiae]MBB3187249.1 nitroreductase [Microbacter margulisiae]
METKTLLQNRRSVNYFDTNKTLSKTTLEEIINLAVLAPSAFNLQPWRIIVVESKEAKETLKTLSNNQPKVTEAAINMIIVGNKNGWDESNPVWEEMLQTVGSPEIVAGAKQAAAFLYGSSEDRKLKFAESNAGLLAMSIMVAAKEFGVDSHPMSGIDFDGIKQVFQLQPEETVVMTIALGYFDSSKALYPRRPRRGFKEIASIV